MFRFPPAVTSPSSPVLLLPALALLACAIVSAGPSEASGQTPFEVRGQVVDDVSGEPLSSVIIRLPRDLRYTLTNENGEFRIVRTSSGPQPLLAVRLGYFDHEEEVSGEGAVELTIRLVRSPIELEAIRVGRDEDLMGRLATRRGTNLGSHWEVFDEDDILGSGTNDPIEFLTGTAGVVVRPCVGITADRSRLCVVGLGPTGEGNRSSAGLRAPAVGGITGRRVGGRVTALDRLRARRPLGSMSAATDWNTRARLGDTYRTVQVYLDDRPLNGSLTQLAETTLDDIHRIETYGDRGERQIRLYSAGYLRMVELGEIRPNFSVPLMERFESGWGDDRWGDDPWPPTRR